MSNSTILHANKKHKDFLIYANKVIDQVNDMNETNSYTRQNLCLVFLLQK